VITLRVDTAFPYIPDLNAVEKRPAFIDKHISLDRKRNSPGMLGKKLIFCKTHGKIRFYSEHIKNLDKLS